MFKKRTTKRGASAQTGSSTADIAFLLLIFFLLATTIPEEQGVLTRLPPWDDHPIAVEISAERVLSVKLNASGELLVAGKPCPASELNSRVRKHLDRLQHRAIISLQHDRGSAYADFLQVYDEILGAYRQAWNERALQQHRSPFEQLSKAKQQEIRKTLPLIISEAEPSNFGEE